MKRWLVVTLLLCGCAEDQLELTLDIRESADRQLFSRVATLHLRAERDGRSLVETTYPPTVGAVSVRGVPYGPRTTFTLEGTSTSGDVIARGSTCPVDFEAPGGTGALRAALYFAPTNSFAPTAGDPLSQRSSPIALTLPTGDVLLSGGHVGTDVVATSEVFSVSTSRFVASDTTLNTARSGAEAVSTNANAVVVIGGQGKNGDGVADGEILRFDTGLYTSFSIPALGPRLGHRAVRLPDDRVLITGGAAIPGGQPLATTATIVLQNDSSATTAAGPDLLQARRDHAAVLASGIAVLIGGYGTSGAPLASIEAYRPPAMAGDQPLFVPVAQLHTARAEATATVLLDGTILVVGGAGDAAETPLLDAEVFNPITRETQVFPLSIGRRGHTATILPDGRVLVVGGVGTDGAPLSSVELFIPAVGFVSERPLGSPRVGHRAVPLCDGSVLVVGGGPGAELYVPPP